MKLFHLVLLVNHFQLIDIVVLDTSTFGLKVPLYFWKKNILVCLLKVYILAFWFYFFVVFHIAFS